LQPTKKHLSVSRYVTPQEFADFAKLALKLGFKHVASAPLVRSSYHADTTTVPSSHITFCSESTD